MNLWNYLSPKKKYRFCKMGFAIAGFLPFHSKTKQSSATLRWGMPVLRGLKVSLFTCLSLDLRLHTRTMSDQWGLHLFLCAQVHNSNGIYWHRFMNTPKNFSIPIYLTLITSLKPPTSCHGAVIDTNYLILLFTICGTEIEFYVNSEEHRKISRRKIHQDPLNKKAGPTAREVPEPKGFGAWGEMSACSLCSYVHPKALSVGHCWTDVWINLYLALFCSFTTPWQAAQVARKTVKHAHSALATSH